MVPVRINDAVTIPFVLDSGAAEVVIPADVFSVLLRSGTISQSDFKGAGQYTIADGSTASSDRYVLHKVTVGDHIITDVIASVSPAKSAPLLGQTFLQRLPAWKLDNYRHALVLNDEGRTTGEPKMVAVPPAMPQLTPQMKCLLEVKGRAYIKGLCDVHDYGDSFQFLSINNNYFGSIDFYQQGVPHGHWNGEEAASHGQNPLGALTRAGDCWSNTFARVCLSAPQKSDIDALPSCGAVVSTLEKMMQKRTGELERHITVWNVKNTVGSKRVCSAMFASYFADPKAIDVIYEISGSEASGYSVHLISAAAR